MATYYTTIQAAMHGRALDVILAHVGNDTDGKAWPDLKREPDFGTFTLPTNDNRRDHAIAAMFTNWCLGSGQTVFIAFDDAGNARAWRYTGGA